MTKQRYPKSVPFNPADMPVAGSAMLGPAMGAAAAMTAVGTAMAAQAWGAWFGLMTGTMSRPGSYGQGSLNPASVFGSGDHWGDDEPETGALAARSAPPASKAVTAAETMGAEMEITGDALRDAGSKIARAIHDDVEAAMETAQAVARANPLCAPLMPQARSVQKNVPAEKNADNSNAAPAEPVAMARAGAADDLKAISGIGPKLEEMLNRSGVNTYADIARWTADDITAFDGKFALRGRIERDDWIGQARKLAGAGNVANG